MYSAARVMCSVSEFARRNPTVYDARCCWCSERCARIHRAGGAIISAVHLVGSTVLGVSTHHTASSSRDGGPRLVIFMYVRALVYCCRYSTSFNSAVIRSCSGKCDALDASSGGMRSDNRAIGKNVPLIYVAKTMRISMEFGYRKIDDVLFSLPYAMTQ
jgi:hypothetical protein